MGNLKAEYLEQTYIDLAPLKDAEDCRTYLTRSQVDGSLAVRKEIIALQYPLYQQLIDLSHPSLARVLDTYAKDGRYFVLEEYVSGSTIGSYLKRGYHFQEEEILSFISQLCSALSFLHTPGYHAGKPADLHGQCAQIDRLWNIPKQKRGAKPGYHSPWHGRIRGSGAVWLRADG